MSLRGSDWSAAASTNLYLVMSLCLDLEYGVHDIEDVAQELGRRQENVVYIDFRRVREQKKKSLSSLSPILYLARRYLLDKASTKN